MGSLEVIFTTIHALSKKSISLLHWNSNLHLFFLIKKDNNNNNNITTDTIEKRRSFCTCEADWPRYQRSRRKKHKEADFIPLPTLNHPLLAFPIHSKISFTSLDQPVLSRSRRGFDEGALRQGKDRTYVLPTSIDHSIPTNFTMILLLPSLSLSLNNK